MEGASSPRAVPEPTEGGPGSRPAGSAGAERRWYVAVGGEVYGPADLPTLRRWTASGRMPTGTQVRPVDGDSWLPVTAFPELRDLALFAPTGPTHQPAAVYPSAEAALSAVAPCPYCRGPVLNMAPPYGWPWGFWQRALKPQFICTSCGAQVRLSQLPPAAQAQVARRMRLAYVWMGVTAVAILIIASPFLVALVYD